MKRRDPVSISAQDYLGPCHSPNRFFREKDGYEKLYNWSDHLKGLSQGFIYHLKCQPGLILSITRQYLSTPLNIFFGEETNFVSLGFSLRDDSHIQHHNPDQETAFSPTQGSLSCIRLKSVLVRRPAKPFCGISIFMEPWFIKRFLQGMAGEYARKVGEMLDLQNEGEIFNYPVFMTPSINVRLLEILGCTYTDARRRLFLGSKALELMMFSFDQLNPNKGQDISCFDSGTDSRDFVHKTRDIIISDIKNPPSLTELSRMVGVNRTTLSQRFCEVYGVSIFNYLRKYRLEESKRLLRTGNRSVTEVAFEVGYGQQRTFSREFKKYFGDKPSAFIRK